MRMRDTPKDSHGWPGCLLKVSESCRQHPDLYYLHPCTYPERLCGLISLDDIFFAGLVQPAASFRFLPSFLLKCYFGTSETNIPIISYESYDMTSIITNEKNGFWITCMIRNQSVTVPKRPPWECIVKSS